MNKVINWLKKIPDWYYNWKRRNEKILEALQITVENSKTLNQIHTAISDINHRLGIIEVKVNGLEEDIEHMDGRLEIIGRGTMMELYQSLYHARNQYVCKRGWATPQEKREIYDIYVIYHDELGGNGQGERYYNEIMALPESKEELESRRK